MKEDTKDAYDLTGDDQTPIKKRFCYYQPERLPCYHCKDIKKGLEQAILKQAGLK